MVVVPIKSFNGGKERLSGFLDESARALLVREMARHVIAVAEEVGLLPVLVTGSGEVADWGAARGLPVLSDPGRGLSAAAETGIGWAKSTGSTWLVLHADLPLLAKEDLQVLTGPLAEGANPIAPSADGGTSAIGGGEPSPLSYGPGSFHRHLARLADPIVVARPGLAHDIDSPADLASARNHPRGAWLDRALA